MSQHVICRDMYKLCLASQHFLCLKSEYPTLMINVYTKPLTITPALYKNNINSNIVHDFVFFFCSLAIYYILVNKIVKIYLYCDIKQPISCHDMSYVPTIMTFVLVG